jgi:hypothetical protein
LSESLNSSDEDDILSDVRQIEATNEQANEQLAQEMVKQNINVIINKGMMLNSYGIKEESPENTTSKWSNLLLTKLNL